MKKRKKTGMPPCTDMGNAEFFAELYKDKLCYDHKNQRWLVWRKHWWSEDSTQEIVQLAKYATRHRFRNTFAIDDDDLRKEELNWARTSEMRSRLEATVILARSETHLARRGTEWDTDPWLLGVANGVVDLKTGSLRRGLPSDGITMHTRVAFQRSANAPLWDEFLKDVFVDDELIDFLQHAVGYSLTGQTSEQCFFACFGDGANGKSTFLETVRYVFDEYAHNTPFSTLELLGRSSIPADLAELDGRRFVTAIETNNSVRLNEARLKGLTGSDAVTARRLYKGFFTFTPVAKFWLAFNHKPSVRDDSYGFWRRNRLIPFTQIFLGDSQNKELLATLRTEAPGILAWAVRGCLKWQAEGLGLPSSVRAATEQYREESDPLRDFIDELCIVQPGKSVAASALWVTYLNWVKDNGEPWPLDRAAFARRLEARGLRKTRVGHARTWTWEGICLKQGHKLGLLTSQADVRTDADGQIQ